MAIVLVTAGWMIFGAVGALPLWSVPFLLVALRWNGVIQHNHSHLPIFRSGWANAGLDVVLALVCVIPQPIYRHMHVQVHHRFLNAPEDWTGPYVGAGTSFPDRPMPLWAYCPTAVPRGLVLGARAIWPARRTRYELLATWLSVAALLLALAVRSPGRTAAFVLLPWAAISLFLPLTNWLQHAGCTYESPSTSANVNLGLFSRTIGFNIGYHSAHHVRPAAHWSKLPDLHTRLIASSIPPSRVRRGLVLDAHALLGSAARDHC